MDEQGIVSTVTKLRAAEAALGLARIALNVARSNVADAETEVSILTSDLRAACDAAADSSVAA